MAELESISPPSTSTTTTAARFYVLDAGVFTQSASGIFANFSGDAILATTQFVFEELVSDSARLAVEILGEKLNLINPKEGTIKEVMIAATEMGEYGISRTDASVIALAKDMGGTVVSDDYTMQNVCTGLNVPWLPVRKKGITDFRKYESRTKCKACGRPLTGGSTCAFCGTTASGKKTLKAQGQK